MDNRTKWIRTRIQIGWILLAAGVLVVTAGIFAELQYANLPYNFRGYITLAFVPYWYVLGLAVEYLYRKVDAVSVLFLLGLRTEDIEGLSRRG